MMNFFFGLLYFSVLFAAILFLAYVSTKFLGSRLSRGMRGNYIKVVDSVSLGFDRQIYLIRVGGQLLLVSSSNKSIQFLTLLDNTLVGLSEEDLKVIEQEPETGTASTFKNYLDVFKNPPGKTNGPISQHNTDLNSNRFKQNLDKLRGIFSKINSEKNGDEKPNE